MFDRSLVTSGFDTETLISEGYLRFLLLAQIEAGLLPLQFEVVDAQSNTNLSVTLHPPAEEEYERLYNPSSDAPLPNGEAFSFRCKLLPGEASGFADVAFTPGDTHLLTRSFDEMVRIWDLNERTQNESAAFAVNPAIGSAFNTQGTQIATASADHLVRVWNLTTKDIAIALNGHTSAVECVAFSPDGQRVVSGSFDQTLRVWDLATGTAIHTLTGNVGRVMSVAFNHAGTQIATGGEDRMVRIWDAASGTPLQVLSGHNGPVNCVVWSANDLRVASGSDDKTARLWDPPSATAPLTFSGHADRVLSVDINAAGTQLLTGSSDKKIKLWTTSGLLRTIDHHSEVVRVRFASVGARNASVSAGGSIRLWDDINTSDTVEIRMDFMRVEVFVTVFDRNTNQTFEGNAALIVYLALDADLTAIGLETNHRLRLSFGRLDPGTKALLETFHVNIQLLEATLRQQLDRDLPLGVAQGLPVRQIRMRK